MRLFPCLIAIARPTRPIWPVLPMRHHPRQCHAARRMHACAILPSSLAPSGRHNPTHTGWSATHTGTSVVCLTRASRMHVPCSLMHLSCCCCCSATVVAAALVCANAMLPLACVRAPCAALPLHASSSSAAAAASCRCSSTVAHQRPPMSHRRRLLLHEVLPRCG